MCIARHDRVRVLLRLFVYGTYQRKELLFYFARFAAQPHPQIDRDLIVSASAGVQLFADIAEARGQHRFDKHMNILGVHIYIKSSVFYVAENPLQAFDQPVAFILRYYSARAEHCGVSHRAFYILFVHTAVKADRRIKVISCGVKLLRKASCPHFIHIIFSLRRLSTKKRLPHRTIQVMQQPRLESLLLTGVIRCVVISQDPISFSSSHRPWWEVRTNL